jgi:hypothetical protein
MATPPDADERPGTLEDRPPVLTWPRIYALVLGALAVQVILYAALTRVMR